MTVAPKRIGQGTLHRRMVKGTARYSGMLKIGDKEYPVSIFKREGAKGVFLSLAVYEKPAGRRRPRQMNLDRMFEDRISQDD